ncbi:MAG: SAM-dependent methyltransferase [Myxococcota bacterium]
MRDLDGYVQTQAAVLASRDDLPASLAGLIRAHAPDPLGEQLRTREIYLRAPAADLAAWARSCIAATGGPILNLGCGTLTFPAPHVTNVDLSWTLLRAAGGSRLLADALDPPFMGGDFHAVVMLNLLDSCRAPHILLQQADALLAPGGRLVLSCAFAYDDTITPRAEQLSEAAVVAFWEDRGYAPVLGEVRWVLFTSARVQTVYTVLTLSGQKPPAR